MCADDVAGSTRATYAFPCRSGAGASWSAARRPSGGCGCGGWAASRGRDRAVAAMLQRRKLTL